MTSTLFQNTAIKDIITGVLFCALIIATIYIIPILGILAWIFLPLPVLFYRLKTGRNSSGIIIAASIILMTVLTGNFVFNTLYFGSLLMTGFLLGEFIEKHLNIEKIMLFTGLTILGICVFVLFIYSLVQSQGISQIISNYISRYLALSSELFSQSNQFYPQIQIDKQTFEKANLLFVYTFPGIFINSYMAMVWLNILLIKKILFKKDIIVKSIENLNQYKAPDYLVFGVIVLSSLIFLSSGVLKYIAINCLIILMLIYFFQGIAVVSFFFQKKSAPFLLRSFFYILIALQPFFIFLVIGFGLFDIWINFRKLNTGLEN